MSVDLEHDCRANPIHPHPIDANPIDADLFRQLLRRQAASVVVVTTRGERPAGFTATSFTSVSLHPPLVSFCLDRASSSWPTIERASHVGVHILAATQEDVARTFATRGIDRFAAHPWRAGPQGVPVIEGALAWLVCRVVEHVQAGDHAVVLAEPSVGAHHEDETRPALVYKMGHYSGI